MADNIQCWAVFSDRENISPEAYFGMEEMAKRYKKNHHPDGLVVEFKVTHNQWDALMQKGRLHWADLVAEARAKSLQPTGDTG